MACWNGSPSFTPVYKVPIGSLWWTSSSQKQWSILVRIMAELAGRLLAQKKGGKKNLCKKSNVLILWQASGLRSSPQTFINPPRAIKGGIRGPKETKSWWIELISPPMMDGPAHRGLQNRSIVHLSLRLPCPSMICTPVVKATSGQKNSLSSPSSSTSLCVSPLPRNSHSSSFLRPSPPLTCRSCSQMHKTTRAAQIISRHTCRHE